ncbi:hypothetical protein IFT92_20850 [Peribacillus simplex]|uniref:hypothetical protein n=1 Tax=Peribacillus simplex TaxID=1478 RepID=UPI0019240B80|nr:hypothetical protein [Peribacillus simplex]MBD8590240.1 hypothetical protein [Peribacillus simplex]
MNRVDAFIEALTEWKNVCDLSEPEFKGFLFNLAYQVGFKESLSVKDVIDLKGHFENLISEQKIKEKFLVNSLILEMNNFFEQNIRNHGEAIIINELTAESYKKDFGLIPDHIQKGVDSLKTRGYRYKLECQLDMWKVIIQRTFNYAQQYEWEKLENEELRERVENQFESFSDIEMNTTFKELIEKSKDSK